MISQESLSQLKSFEKQRLDLKKENARLRDSLATLHKKFDKVSDADDSATREPDRLKKAHEDDLQVISNLGDSLPQKPMLGRMLKTKFLLWKLGARKRRDSFDAEDLCIED